MTAGGVTITRTAVEFDPADLAGVAALIDRRRGGVLSSGMEYPGRYSRWHLAYVNPPVEITTRGREVTARALNDRGLIILPAIADAMRRVGTEISSDNSKKHGVLDEVTVFVPEGEGAFTEEERSRQPTVFSALREIVATFACGDPHLGLYGAFGYDLAFQFEPVRPRIDRAEGQRDLVLHLPDEILVVDLRREEAIRYRYEFEFGGVATSHLPRQTADTPELAAGEPWAEGRRPGPFLPVMIVTFPFPGGMPPSSSGPRTSSGAATSSRSCRATCSAAGACRRRRSTSGCGGGTRRRSSSCSTSVTAST